MNNPILDLVVFAMAVERMRAMQKRTSQIFTGALLAELREAEAEVDKLTACYLFPSPSVVDGKDGA